MERISNLRWPLLACLAFITTGARAYGPYYYTGAQWAVQAQCPANYPISCNSISQGNYCCPSGQYCTWADAKVACCPNDCTCSGWSSGQDTYSSYRHHSSWHPHSSWRPASTHWHSSYHPEPTCDVCSEHTTTVVVRPQGHYSSQPASHPAGYGGYCSTIYAQGPGLPTSRQEACGLVLIESPPPNAAGRTYEKGYGVGMVLWVVGLQVLGGMVLVWR